jgi:hypothetical protein
VCSDPNLYIYIYFIYSSYFTYFLHFFFYFLCPHLTIFLEGFKLLYLLYLLWSLFLFLHVISLLSFNFVFFGKYVRKDMVKKGYDIHFLHYFALLWTYKLGLR